MILLRRATKFYSRLLIPVSVVIFLFCSLFSAHKIISALQLILKIPSLITQQIHKFKLTNELKLSKKEIRKKLKKSYPQNCCAYKFSTLDDGSGKNKKIVFSRQYTSLVNRSFADKLTYNHRLYRCGVCSYYIYTYIESWNTYKENTPEHSLFPELNICVYICPVYRVLYLYTVYIVSVYAYIGVWYRYVCFIKQGSFM